MNVYKNNVGRTMALAYLIAIAGCGREAQLDKYSDDAIARAAFDYYIGPGKTKYIKTDLKIIYDSRHIYTSAKPERLLDGTYYAELNVDKIANVGEICFWEYGLAGSSESGLASGFEYSIGCEDRIHIHPIEEGRKADYIPAQQVDAPEPATNAVPASRPPLAPAR